MENIIHHVCQGCDKISEVGVIRGEELYKQGLKVFYSVGKGATDPPRLVHLVYRGNPHSETVEYAIAGKGITFDCGGVNVKAHPEDMYCDKAGCCTTLGILKGCIEMNLKMNV